MLLSSGLTNTHLTTQGIAGIGTKNSLSLGNNQESISGAERTNRGMPTRQYQIGKPFDIADLKKLQRARAVSPRDQELEKAITQAAAGAASQVIPFSFDPERDKAGTVKAAAKRIVKAMGVPVNVGFNAKFPNTILLSRGVLSNRGRHSK
jgi:hypothetical protein